MATLDSNPLVVLCPGQGAQAVGMGRAWFQASPKARATFEHADSVLGGRLGAPLSRLCFDGPPEVLNRTDVSQPAIFVTSVACWRGLLEASDLGEGEAPLAACAGLSLGEYTALHIAGVLTFDEALNLVTLRGRAMQDAAEASPPSGMVALIGADDEQAAAVARDASSGDILVCANFNAPGQVVLSGSAPACARAADLAASRGFRAAHLAVAGAFHSPFMQPAADRLADALAKTSLRPARAPVLSNVTGAPHDHTMPQTIRARLVEQLTSPVRWAACVRWLAVHAPGQPHELAPGKTLAGLARKIDRNLKVNTHDLPTD